MKMNGRLKMNTAVSILCLFILQMPACSGSPTRQEPQSRDVFQSDVSFIIIPEENTFSSHQRITFQSNFFIGDRLSFYLHGNLQIDSVHLEDLDGAIIPTRPWRIASSYSSEEWWGSTFLNEVVITSLTPNHSDRKYILDVSYHLDPDLIQQGKPDNLYELFISSQGSLAGGPESGAFVMFANQTETTFTLSLTHPNGITCISPGDLVEQDQSGSLVTDHFRSDVPFDLSFACDTFAAYRRELNAFQIEVVLPSVQRFSMQMLDAAASTLEIYLNHFGLPSTSSFKLVFLDMQDGSTGAESNGNLFFLTDYAPYKDFDSNPDSRINFTDLVAHEGYHLWNTWTIDWQGSLSQWWVEGGANFMTVRCRDELYGSEEAASLRREFIESYETHQAYLHKDPLADLQDDWFDDWSLVYDYGALVWEQLFKFVGEEAFWDVMKEIYQPGQNREISYPEFIQIMKHHTALDVDSFIHQWTYANVKLDISILDVQMGNPPDQCTVELDFMIEPDQSTDIVTSIGYRTISNQKWQYKNQLLNSKTNNQIIFECGEPISEIRLDPFNQVPQINLANNYWISSE